MRMAHDGTERSQQPGGAETQVGHEASEGRRTESKQAAVLPRTGPPSSPDLQRFIDSVIVPALLERLLRDQQPREPQAA